VAIVALMASPGNVFSFPFNWVYYIAMLCSQICAGALLFVQIRRGAQPDSLALSPRGTARRAFTLALGSAGMMMLVLLIKAWALGMSSSTWILWTDLG